MAELVFFDRAEFGAGAIAFRHPKQRVIAKPMLTAGGRQNTPVPQAFADDGQRIVRVTHQGQHTHKLCATLCFGHILEGVEQFGVIRRIAFAVRVTCRINARRAAEKIHRQPRVIRQCWQTRNTRRIAGFKNRVFNKRQAGFFRLDAAEFSNRAQLHRLAEHGLKFFEFAGVVASQYQLRKVHHSIGATI